jgi:hypothetical protein
MRKVVFAAVALAAFVMGGAAAVPARANMICNQWDHCVEVPSGEWWDYHQPPIAVTWPFVYPHPAWGWHHHWRHHVVRVRG